ncbi:GtrA family protein [Acinetobacter sp. WZC-1]|uniref:GtrA family protein n=1 Tax=Acinetobacter sp. WZC-1 TaxID=3459034 RepID=UPI00403E3070
MPVPISQLIRFATVGVLAGFIHYCLVMLLFKQQHIPLQYANFFAFLTAFWVSYFGHRILTFKAQQIPHRQTLPRFILVAGIGFLFNESFLLLASLYWHNALSMQVIMAILLTSIVTFLLNRRFAFHHQGIPHMQQWLRSSRFLIVFLPIWLFASSCIRYLSVPDEGRYGDISRHMVESGDWLIPRINGLPFMHKPPLLHWLSSVFMEIAGVHIWTLRLVPVLAGTVMLVSLFLFVRKHISEHIAQLTIIILATNLLFFGSSEYINHDLLVAAWMTVSILCFVDFSISARRSILLLGYFAGAAAFLSKGLIGILIPGMVLLPWLLYTGQWKKIPSLLHPAGILLFLALTLPWLYMVQLRYPQFLHYFFIDQQFSRFNSTQFNNKQPWFYYLLILAASFLPWLLVSGFKFSKATLKEQLSSSLSVLGLWWLLSVTLFFSIPPSKLAGYILPAVPPLAVCMAVMISCVLMQPDKNRLQVYGIAVFLLILGTGIALTPQLAGSKQAFYLQQSSQIYAVAAVLICLPLILLWRYQHKKLEYFSYVFICLIVLCTSVSYATRLLDTKNNATQIDFSQYIQPSSQIIFYHYYFYDVPFLLDLKKPVYIVDNWENVHSDGSSLELKDGLLFEPQLKQYLWNEQQLQTALASKQPFILLSRPNNFSTTDKHVKILHYRNYDVFLFNSPS